MTLDNQDDGIRRDRLPGVPTDVTADEPKLSPDRPLPDVDVRMKGPGCERLVIFSAVGAASGLALMVFLVAGCHAEEAANGLIAGGAWQPGLEQLFLIVAPAAGGFLGLLLALAWRWRPPKPPWSD